ncbi:serine/threonine-protein phosphatase 4 regulatory subunit 1 isoform X2 [Anabrus simplex]|uniref:serine/threonine-protein phosphatase 4 regulatory subunit 1 isoform X2 n=1 Tax=Anabrus simplex TaxID=316456 RepID=UPI0035A30502
MYLQDEDGECSEEVSESMEADTASNANQDDFLPPLYRLEKYATSKNIFNRQLVGRFALETLRVVIDSPGDVATVMTTLTKMADDPEVPVRVELMEQVPHIAMLWQEDHNRLQSVMMDYLLPLVVKLLSDQDNQVRKTTQAALLVLMEQGLIDKNAVEEKVCPVILSLTQVDGPVEFHTGAVALMSKMAPLIGCTATERLFLDRFATLCTDPVFYVRKVCAANFGDFCSVVGTQSTEEILLPRFVDLCADDVWGVRKSTAEVFVSVSCACSLSVRKNTLAPVFANLLVDQSRWVRMSAFKALGPFISTFADLSVTGLGYNQHGDLVLMNPEKLECRLGSSEAEENGSQSILALNPDGVVQCVQEENSIYSASTSANSNETSGTNCSSGSGEETEKHITSETAETPENQECQQLRVSDLSGQLRIHAESGVKTNLSDNNKFNTFQYWRVPIPEIELDISLTDNWRPTALHVKAKVKDETTLRTYASELQLNMDVDIDNELDNLATRLEHGSFEDSSTNNPPYHQAQICSASMAMVTDTNKQGSESTTIVSSGIQKAVLRIRPKDGTTDVKMIRFKTYDPTEDPFASELLMTSEETLQAIPLSTNPPSQDIVPQLLIDHFVSMTHPSQVQNTDNEITHYCAFSIPAVALTLGRANWNLIKKAYEALASDRQWKVRRTVASSIHELAVILGEEIATRDLVPVFIGFIKDLDEVRIGALKHLADFLKLLRPLERNSFLYRLPDFHFTDNEYNWRFREILAEQLLLTVTLFSPADSRRHITPLAVALLKDKVFAVRQMALALMTQLIQCISVEPRMLRSLTNEVVEQFAHNCNWSRRQSYALLCGQLVNESAVDCLFFYQEFMGHLGELASDSVPNVRLAVARTMTEDLLAKSFFQIKDSPQYRMIMGTLERLQQDEDRDVRHFATVRSSSPVHPEADDFVPLNGSDEWAD